MTRIACSTYSFNQLISKGEISQLESLQLAKEMGFDAIEIVDLIHDESIAERDYVYQLKEELERLNFPITSFTFHANLLHEDAEQTHLEIKRIKKMIDYAEILGAKRIRHDVAWGQSKKSFDIVLPDLALACRTITEYAANKQIITMVENHGFFVQDSDRMEKLYNQVHHPNFKLLIDVGNFLCVDESPVHAVSRLAPFAEYVHIKDFHVKSGREAAPGEGFFQTRGGNFLRGAIIGHGNVPLTQCFNSLKNSGYQGDVAIEFEGMEDNREGVRISLENVRKQLSEYLRK